VDGCGAGLGEHELEAGREGGEAACGDGVAGAGGVNAGDVGLSGVVGVDLGGGESIVFAEARLQPAAKLLPRVEGDVAPIRVVAVCIDRVRREELQDPREIAGVVGVEEAADEGSGILLELMGAEAKQHAAVEGPVAPALKLYQTSVWMCVPVWRSWSILAPSARLDVPSSARTSLVRETLRSPTLARVWPGRTDACSNLSPSSTGTSS